MILILILRTILRYPVGNDFAANMDESALGPWISVVRKSSHCKKAPFQKSEEVFLGQVPKMASLTVANASSSKSLKSSLRLGCSESLFEKECREDPKFLQQVSSLERMFRVKKQHDEAVGAAATAGAFAGDVGLRDGLDGATVAGAAAPGSSGILRLSEVGGIVGLRADAKVDGAGVSGLPSLPKVGGGAGGFTPEARVASTAGELAGYSSLIPVSQSACSSLCHKSSLARSCADGDESCAVGVSSASVSAASGVAALPVRSLTYARAAANACGEVTGGSNSWVDTAINSLRVQNSRRKVRLSSSVGSRSVVRTVDMSPVPVTGTYRRSADKVHDQRQVSRKRRAESSGGGPGPGPGPGGRFGRGGGVSGHAAASLEIPCSLVMPPGRHQHAPQSLGWARVCGTERSGIWVLKGATRTYNLPRNLDDVGIVWERRSGYETAWATRGHVCSCSYDYGRGPVLPQANPSVFTEAVNLWSRVASLLTPWCAKGEVPTGVNLNQYAGNGSFIPWHCDNQPLFGSPFEPKVIVSMSLGHSVLFKLRRRASKNTPSQIWLDHGDLLVMDGLTQYEYEHSTAFELEGPRVNLTYRWISQHIRSCPLTVNWRCSTFGCTRFG